MNREWCRLVSRRAVSIPSVCSYYRLTGGWYGHGCDMDMSSLSHSLCQHSHYLISTTCVLSAEPWLHYDGLHHDGSSQPLVLGTRVRTLLRKRQGATQRSAKGQRVDDPGVERQDYLPCVRGIGERQRQRPGVAQTSGPSACLADGALPDNPSVGVRGTSKAHRVECGIPVVGDLPVRGRKAF